MVRARWVRSGTDPDAVRELFALVAGRLAGDPGAPIILAPDDGAADAALSRVAQPLDGVDVIIATSGSADGRGHLVGLSWEALCTSARATLDRLGGPGQWIAALPTSGVGGLQVVVRSVLAEIPPQSYAPSGGFDARMLADRLDRARPGVPCYTAFVPTQLVRALDAAPELLSRFEAILVGGAPLSASLARRAADHGITVVTTYGMTETSGGCVYDGAPLDGVEVDLTPEGIVRVRGAILMQGYLDASEQPFTDGGWLVTNDLGIQDDGRLRIVGRADDVIISGGVNVHPGTVEQALSALGGAWVVVGVPDAEWGERVVAVTLTGTAADLQSVRDACAGLVPAARPRELQTLSDWPCRPSGKVDRRAVSRLVS